MTKKFNQYLGKAGHLAVMAEFLIRGWNVAIPEVDIGDDIFVVQDDNGTLRRVQVKTSTATSKQTGIGGMFSLNIKNLRRITNILVHYVFITRQSNTWTRPVIIRQDYLLDHFLNDGVGSQYKDAITLIFTYSDEKVKCSKQDFSKYICNYSDFPEIEH